MACTDRIRRQQAEQRKVRAELAELEAYLARPETRALSQKLEKLSEDLKQAQEKSHSTDVQIQVQQSNLDHYRPELSKKKLICRTP